MRCYARKTVRMDSLETIFALMLTFGLLWVITWINYTYILYRITKYQARQYHPSRRQIDDYARAASKSILFRLTEEEIRKDFTRYKMDRNTWETCFETTNASFWFLVHVGWAGMSCLATLCGMPQTIRTGGWDDILFVLVWGVFAWGGLIYVWWLTRKLTPKKRSRK